MRLDRRFDDDDLADESLLAPLLGRVGRLCAGALEHQRNISRGRRVLYCEGRSKPGKPDRDREYDRDKYDEGGENTQPPGGNHLSKQWGHSPKTNQAHVRSLQCRPYLTLKRTV